MSYPNAIARELDLLQLLIMIKHFGVNGTRAKTCLKVIFSNTVGRIRFPRSLLPVLQFQLFLGHLHVLLRSIAQAACDQ
jgi:hypothetical protein